MAWLSFFRRKPATEAPAANGARTGARRRASAEAEAADVDQARARARRRLIGATVLLGVGIIAFPLLFETEPRPIPVDLPIEIPRRDAPPLPAAAPSPPSTNPGIASGRVADAPPAEAKAETPVDGAASAPAAVSPHPAAPAPASTASEAARPAASGTAGAAASPPARSEASAPASRVSAAVNEGARARALLEGRTIPDAPGPVPAAKTAVAAKPASAPDDPAAATAPRFIVQVGAYADDGAVRAVRARVERLGLRTYTQIVKVEAGERTRVRVGPFDDRGEADKVAARLKAAGLPSAVLRL